MELFFIGIKKIHILRRVPTLHRSLFVICESFVPGLTIRLYIHYNIILQNVKRFFQNLFKKDVKLCCGSVTIIICNLFENYTMINLCFIITSFTIVFFHIRPKGKVLSFLTFLMLILGSKL